jgi:CHASE1-domain containing sensor protein
VKLTLILKSYHLQYSKKDFWLSDEHIDHAQWLLQQHFAGCNGLHSVLAFEGKTPKFREDKRSLFKSLMLEENIG